MELSCSHNSKFLFTSKNMQSKPVSDIYLSDYNIDIEVSPNKYMQIYEGQSIASDLFIFPRVYLSPVFRIVARPIKLSKNVLRYMPPAAIIHGDLNHVDLTSHFDPGYERVDIRPWTMELKEIKVLDLLRRRERKIGIQQFGKKTKKKKYHIITWYELDEVKVLEILREQFESFLNIDVRAEVLMNKIINRMYEMYDEAN